MESIDVFGVDVESAESADLCTLVERGDVEGVRCALQRPDVDVNQLGGSQRPEDLEGGSVVTEDDDSEEECSLEAEDYEEGGSLGAEDDDEEEGGSPGAEDEEEEERGSRRAEEGKEGPVRSARTPLAIALENESAEIVKLLLQHPRIEVNAVSVYRGVPLVALHVAAFKNFVEGCSLLLRQPSLDVNAGDICSALHIAAAKHEVEIVKLLLQHSLINVNKRGFDTRFTALHLAASEQVLSSTSNLESLKDLFDLQPVGVNGRDQAGTSSRLPARIEIAVNARHGIGTTPLHMTAKTNAKECMELLLNQPGIDINVRDEDEVTPLHLTAEANAKECMELLLKRPQIDINVRDKAGFTPLHATAKVNAKKCMQLLLKHPKIDINVRDTHGASPLHVTAEADAKECMELFLRRPGIDINMRNKAEVTPLHLTAKFNAKKCMQLLLKNPKIDINARDAHGASPLHEAGKVNSMKCMELVLEHPGIDINVRDRSGATPLHATAKANAKECMELLVKHPQIDINVRDENKVTPLHVTAEAHARECMELLLKHRRIHINLKDRAGVTPLHLTAKFKAKGCMQLLLRHRKIEINVRDDNKVTPLHQAVIVNSMKCVELLLEQPGIGINVRDKAGVTPLHITAKVNARRCMRLLLKNPKTDINARDADGASPLHEAVKGHSVRCVELLLEQPGIDINVRDKAGLTPLHESAKCLAMEILKTFMKHLMKHREMTMDDVSFPEYVASRRRNALCMRRLLEHSKIEINVRDESGVTPLLAAVKVFTEASAVKVIRAVKVFREASPAKVIRSGRIFREACDKDLVHALVESFTIRRGINVNAGDNAGLTPLHAAAKVDDDICVQALLRSDGIDVNVRDEAGFTPLHTAVKFNAKACVHRLLAHRNIDVNARDEAELTPLHIAVKFNEDAEACVEMLVSRSAFDINVRDKAGLTPLRLAVDRDSSQVVKHLFTRKEILVNVADAQGLTALHVAVRNDRRGIVSILLSHPDVDPNGWSQNAPRDSVLADSDSKLRSKLTPLFYAVENSSWEIVHELLIHYRIDVFTGNEESQWASRSALDKVIEKCQGDIFQEWMEACMRKDGAINNLAIVLKRCRDDQSKKGFILDALQRMALGINPRPLPQTVGGPESGTDAAIMHKIASADSSLLTEAAFVLIYKDVNGVDSQGQTPLHFAITYEHYSLARALASKSSLRANQEDANGKTALQKALKRGRTDIEKVLLERADVKDFVDRLYRDRQVHVDAANAILVGAALIAGVTFAGWMQPPLGYTQYYDIVDPDPAAPPGTVESYAGVRQHKSVRIYWVFNSLSFFFAIATVIAGAAAVLPTEDMFIGDEVRLVRRSLMVTSVFLVFSVVSVLGAFGAAGFASLPPIQHLEMPMIVTAAIGSMTCACVLGWFLVRMYRIRPSWLLRSSPGKYRLRLPANKSTSEDIQSYAGYKLRLSTIADD